MKKIYLLLLSGTLLAACSKKETTFYHGYGSPVPNGSTLNSNIRIVSLCTVPTTAYLQYSTSQNSIHPYVDHLFWDLVLGGKSQAANGMGGYSNSLVITNTAVPRINNPLPATPLPNTLPANAPGAPTAPSGLIATPYAIPDSLLDGSGNAHIQVNFGYAFYQNNNHLKDSIVNQLDTSLANTAQDIFFYNHSFLGQVTNTVYPTSSTDFVAKVFPRAVAVSDATRFKIRVINLSHGVPAIPPLNGAVDVSLAGSGKVSLCYANAAPVNTTTTSSIAPGTASDYIELPYGTYQFKILDERNILVPGNSGQHTNGGGRTGYSITGPAGDNFPPGFLSPGLAYTPIRTYVPGGIYTLVVFDNLYSDGTNPSTLANILEPEYEVIADNKPAANISYSKIQWANALPGTTGVTLQVDGQNVQGPLDFGNSSGYTIFNYGQHTVTLKDNNNNTLVSNTFQLPAMANYTVWAYADADNQPQISFVGNAMDFTNSGTQKGSEFNFACRFINYCPDVPFATLTSSNMDGRTNTPTNDAIYLVNAGPTVPVKVYENLPFAQPIQDTAYLMPPNPMTSSIYFGAGYLNRTTFYPMLKVSAMASQPYPSVIVPGDPIPELTPLDRPFFANPALYPHPDWQPYAEAGVYTVALIGRIGDKDPARKVRLMVIKHVQ